MWVLVLICYALLVIYEFIPLYKQKLWSDFRVNIVLGLLSLTIAILLSIGIKIPSPSDPIEKLIVLLVGK